MITLSAHEVIARIDELAREHGSGVVAFDGDGTLWSGDVGDEYFFALIERADVRPSALARLQSVAESHGIDASGPGVALAGRIFEEYRAGRYPEPSICELIAWLCADWSKTEVAAFAEQVLKERGLAQRLHPEVLDVARAVRAQGHRTIIVSASPRPIIEAAARFADFTEVVATSPKWKNDIMLAETETPIPYDDGKVAGLRHIIGSAPLLCALGDNAFDVPMLRTAHLAVAVRPKSRLLARAAEVQGLVRLAESSSKNTPNA